MILMGMLHTAFLILVTLDLVEPSDKYELDKHCEDNSIPIKWLGDKEWLTVHGKTDEERTFRECVIMFGPSSKATKKTTQVKVHSFYIIDCGVTLSVQQSPKTTFGVDSSTLFDYSCKTPAQYGTIYHSDAGNNIWLILKKENRDLLGYNFELNITLTDHVVEQEPMSGLLVASIVLLITIVLLGISAVICRWYRLQKFQSGDFTDSSSNSHDHTVTRYSDLRENDRLRRGSQHSQACILGSVNADGLCTVCNRHHDDFAHIVDVNQDGSVLDTTHSPHENSTRQRQNGDTNRYRQNNQNQHTTHACILGSQNSEGRCTVCNRFHEDFAHVVDVNNEGEVARTVSSRQDANRNTLEDLSYSDRSNDSSPMVLHTPLNLVSNSNRNNARGLVPDDEDDDDVDLSGNDLIPPSYDLSPPSYDEAVNMPKPDPSTLVSNRQQQSNSATNRPRQELVNGGHHESVETDPLYQNLDGLTR